MNFYLIGSSFSHTNLTAILVASQQRLYPQKMQLPKWRMPIPAQCRMMRDQRKGVWANLPKVRN